MPPEEDYLINVEGSGKWFEYRSWCDYEAVANQFCSNNPGAVSKQSQKIQVLRLRDLVSRRFVAKRSELTIEPLPS